MERNFARAGGAAGWLAATTLVVAWPATARADTYTEAYASTSKVVDKTVATAGPHTFALTVGQQTRTIAWFRDGRYLASQSPSVANGWATPSFSSTLHACLNVIEARVFLGTRDRKPEAVITWRVTATIPDVQAPTAPGIPDLVAGNDTGPSSTDNITKWQYPQFTTAKATDHCGVKGYWWSMNDPTPETGGVFTTEPSFQDLVLLGSTTHTAYVRAVDHAGNLSAVRSLPMRVDLNWPLNVTLSSPPTGGQLTTVQPTLSWQPATDTESGVAVYHLKVIQAVANAVPIIDKDVTGTSYTLQGSEALTWNWPYNYNWDVRPIDWAGNTSVSTDGRFVLKDLNKPSNPNTSLGRVFQNAYFDYPLGGWTNARTLIGCWGGASDGESGINKYLRVWSSAADTVPEVSTTSQLQEVTGGTPPPGSVACLGGWLTAGGTWYLHVRTVDKQGNIADGAYHIGPFNVDLLAPTMPSIPAFTDYVDTTQTVVLTWPAATDTGGSGVASYEVQVTTVPTSTTPAVTLFSQTSTTTSVTVAAGVLPRNKVLRLLVKAIDAAGNRQPSSSSLNFSTAP